MTAMTTLSSIIVQDVELMPAALAPGVLYVSARFRTAAHLCACGCGTKVVTPLKAGGWSLTKTRDGMVSLDPSIGNFNLPCQSHYWIRAGNIVWARPWTQEQIVAGRAHDHALRQAHLAQHQLHWLRRVGRWIKSVLSIR